MDVPGKKIIWYNLNQIWVRPPAPPIVEDAVLKNFFFCGGWGVGDFPRKEVWMNYFDITQFCHDQ